MIDTFLASTRSKPLTDGVLRLARPNLPTKLVVSQTLALKKRMV